MVIFGFSGIFFMEHGVRLNISFLMVDREMEVEALFLLMFLLKLGIIRSAGQSNWEVL